ncbi:MAG: hypothetical protein AXA67_05160 [Methylothermaceae bacteria B42]|nr:MAG: hypothetical protein AXA67_05160 [Methylothermaceae bacteria B42]HHJ39357.1 hypothetical protein [Methylothermaceae bacterium]
MTIYAGMLIEEDRCVVSLLDQNNQVQEQIDLPADLLSLLKKLEPYRFQIEGIAVARKKTDFTLVYGLMEAGYPVHLLQPSVVKRWAHQEGENLDPAQLLARRLKYDLAGKGQRNFKSSVNISGMLGRIKYLVSSGKLATQ